MELFKLVENRILFMLTIVVNDKYLMNRPCLYASWRIKRGKLHLTGSEKRFWNEPYWGHLRTLIDKAKNSGMAGI